MRHDKPIRIIKQSAKNQEEKRPAAAACEERRGEEDARKMKTVVSGWVMEHRRRTEEFLQTYNLQLEKLGFNSQVATARH